ncbi:OadG family protein [Selenihalanaerobacter shriftii]|uniref:Oxaloacetate decarboxylase, gamma chain n=1 Tax=Selenihalanaerobacter shriftii TaxID=142842 RepID=A0A1T4JTL2_9FIRM|nr:OadG family protein [Selenihalanaerobacter shriftii]SJZ33550.1 Oxaloacetate decarboxylase, gamma chain [Selenihalanaerobacter shriftii]
MENFGTGLEISLIGMLAVIFTLSALGVVIKVIEKLFHEETGYFFKKKNEDEEVEANAEVTKNETVSNEAESTKGLTAAKVAAISAAVTSYLMAEESDYVITSIKPAGTNWKLSGRQSLLANQSNVAKSRKISNVKLKRQNRLRNYNSGGALKNA